MLTAFFPPQIVKLELVTHAVWPYLAAGTAPALAMAVQVFVDRSYFEPVAK